MSTPQPVTDNRARPLSTRLLRLGRSVVQVAAVVIAGDRR